MVKVAINGFGRIGRLLLRIGMKDPKMEFVAINDLSEKKLKAHLFKYDSIHGRFDGEVSVDDNALTINGKKIKLFSETDPEKLPWKELGVDIVAECTGAFRTKKLAEKHIKAGAKKVLVSAPCKVDKESTEMPRTIVLGVNEKLYDKKKDNVVSSASCTTNCLAPMVKVLNDKFGVKRGLFVTVHAYTANQNLVDGANKKLARARAAALNIVPTSTGAAEATAYVIPSMKGKLEGYALRVPVADGSITDLAVELKKETTVDEINSVFKAAAKKELRGILEYNDEEIVSTDIIGNEHSTIFDGTLTQVQGQKSSLVRVCGWYDNEYGFSCRMIEFMKQMM